MSAYFLGVSKSGGFPLDLGNAASSSLILFGKEFVTIGCGWAGTGACLIKSARAQPDHWQS